MNPNVRLDDQFDMEQKQQVDTANEPVDPTSDAEFMDTGVLHDEGYKTCTDPACQKKHPHPEEESDG